MGYFDYFCVRTDGKNQGFECSLKILIIRKITEKGTN